MKRFLTIMLLLCCAVALQAQIVVKEFYMDQMDITANTNGTIVEDQNGEKCALIKVETTQTGFSFDVGALGVTKTEQHVAEIWVYVPRGVKRISIFHQQLGVLRDYDLGMMLEAARTYVLKLTTGEVHTLVQQATTSQYVVFQVSPADAVVHLDGELLKTADGAASKMVKFGTYEYRVEAPDHKAEVGKVTIDDPDNKKILTVTLKPNFVPLTITVPDNDAEIWVNGEKKGNGSWTGNLGAGTYVMEAKKAGHRSIRDQRDIEVTGEPQTVTLQAPVPMYGRADINSTPIMADIYIDEQKRGQTPQLVSKLLVGNHQLRLSRKGYADYQGSITIRENETTPFTTPLKQQQAAAPVQQQGGGAAGNVETYTVGGVSFNMVRVDGGTFTMGATSEQGSDAYGDEKPAHQVTLSSYYIGETEVTQELWQAVMGSNPSKYTGSKRPVEQVSWEDCQEFIKKLNQKTGKQFRLPTEAEWEFAARGGTKSRHYKYSGSNDLDAVAWYWENSGDKRLSGNWDFNKVQKNNCRTHDVKTKQANELGLYDMSGNVWEWCQDWYDSYSSSSQTNPKGANSGSDRVHRGGGWNGVARGCRVSNRYSDAPSGRFSNLGLRLAF